MTEENTNVSSEQDGNVTINSPLPVAETEQVTEKVATKSRLREALESFHKEVSTVVSSDMADKDAFALIRQSFRNLRIEKQSLNPIAKKTKSKLKLKNKKKGIIKGKRLRKSKK